LPTRRTHLAQTDRQPVALVTLEFRGGSDVRRNWRTLNCACRRSTAANAVSRLGRFRPGSHCGYGSGQGTRRRHPGRGAMDASSTCYGS